MFYVAFNKPSRFSKMPEWIPIKFNVPLEDIESGIAFDTREKLWEYSDVANCTKFECSEKRVESILKLCADVFTYESVDEGIGVRDENGYHFIGRKKIHEFSFKYVEKESNG